MLLDHIRKTIRCQLCWRVPTTLRIPSFLFLRVGLLRTQSEEPAPHNGGVSREGTCSSKTLAKPQRSQARHPSRTIIITERFLEGQSQNKQSASQGSNTSPYHRLWRPHWYLVAVTWVIFLSNSISLARLLPLWSSFFFSIIFPVFPIIVTLCVGTASSQSAVSFFFLLL